MDSVETTTANLAVPPKAKGRNVPLKTMLTSLSKLSDDGSQFFDTFRIFPQLQPELRQLIWAHACFHPRAVMLFAAIYPWDLTPIRTNPGQRKILAVLETCKEYRDEALKYYTETREWVYLPPTPIFLAPGAPPANGQPFQPIRIPPPHCHRNVITILQQESFFSPDDRERLAEQYNHFSHVSSIQVLDQAHDFMLPNPMIETLKELFDSLVGLKELTYIHQLQASPRYWLGLEDNLEMQLLVNEMKHCLPLPTSDGSSSTLSSTSRVDLAPVSLTNGLYDRDGDIGGDPHNE
ncbi:hypothetical protein BKA64DRAFT_728879 [Cadophora sp. MPI-SDFR-AT-0126]|nr:hypothetical protein BKA64DRAFT_728879 [Leotiomycetes sp. MPI-SDFR-AT-0126]